MSNVEPAQIPTSFIHEIRAWLRCRLVKTYDQEDLFLVVTLLQCLKNFHENCRTFVKKSVFSMFFVSAYKQKLTVDGANKLKRSMSENIEVTDPE